METMTLAVTVVEEENGNSGNAVWLSPCLMLSALSPLVVSDDRILS